MTGLSLDAGTLFLVPNKMVAVEDGCFTPRCLFVIGNFNDSKFLNKNLAAAPFDLRIRWCFLYGL